MRDEKASVSRIFVTSLAMVAAAISPRLYRPDEPLHFSNVHSTMVKHLYLTRKFWTPERHGEVIKRQDSFSEEGKGASGWKMWDG